MLRSYVSQDGGWAGCAATCACVEISTFALGIDEISSSIASSSACIAASPVGNGEDPGLSAAIAGLNGDTGGGSRKGEGATLEGAR